MKMWEIENIQRHPIKKVGFVVAENELLANEMVRKEGAIIVSNTMPCSFRNSRAIYWTLYS